MSESKDKTLLDEIERLRGMLDRALEYTRCEPDCPGSYDPADCVCGRVELDDEISETLLGGRQ